jgi:5-methylthioadenosine/S-adenosylhomocysteine deaminase
MNPDIPETKVLDNPYTYTDYRSASTHTSVAGRADQD